MKNVPGEKTNNTRRIRNIEKSKTRINRAIKVSEVRVIDAEGKQLGVLATNKAMDIAVEQGLDLVEVSPNAEPPVCRLMDYGKYKYQQSKKVQKKKTHHTSQTKEIKLRPFTGEHDLEVKLRHILEFLDRGSKVKITVVFRGREMRFKEQGQVMMSRIIESIEDSGVLEREPRMEGRNMVMMLSPHKKQ